MCKCDSDGSHTKHSARVRAFARRKIVRVHQLRWEIENMGHRNQWIATGICGQGTFIGTIHMFHLVECWQCGRLAHGTLRPMRFPSTQIEILFYSRSFSMDDLGGSKEAGTAAYDAIHCVRDEQRRCQFVFVCIGRCKFTRYAHCLGLSSHIRANFLCNLILAEIDV